MGRFLASAALAAIVVAVPLPAAAQAPTGKEIQSRSSDYGKVLFDGKGRVAYLFEKEKGTTPRCYGACAKIWPPILTRGKPSAGSGADQSKLGTTKRKDGKTQITYDGHPLYYWYGDGPGEIGCQNVNEFGGLWVVVRPDGSGVHS